MKVNKRLIIIIYYIIVLSIFSRTVYFIYAVIGVIVLAFTILVIDLKVKQNESKKID